MVVPRNTLAGVRLGLLFPKVPNSRRVSGCFCKSAQIPAGLGLLFSKVPNSRRGLLYFFQKCPIPGGSWVAFAKVARAGVRLE